MEKKKFPRKDTADLDPVRLKVADWLAKQHGIPETLDGHMVAESKKALLIRVSEDKDIWLPKSQIEELPLSLETFFGKKDPADSITFE